MRLMAGRAARQPTGNRPSEGQAHGDERVAEVALRADRGLARTCSGGGSAAMDRLLHNAHVVVVDGDTYRNPPPAKKARCRNSGNGRSAAG